MKFRTGFVSNSSSSSFIVNSYKWDDSTEQNIKAFKAIYDRYIDEYGAFRYIPSTEFGWGLSKHNDIHSKFDWCCLMLWYHEHDATIFNKYYEVFFNVMKEIFPYMERFIYNDVYKPEDDEEYYDPTGYIDHQSVHEENCSMFESEGDLKRFLFNDDAVIYVQNDNTNVSWDPETGKKVKYDCNTGTYCGEDYED